jgi:hypothetical protein
LNSVMMEDGATCAISSTMGGSMRNSIAIVSVAFVVLLSAVACGSTGDKYEGTWIQKQAAGDNLTAPITIEKISGNQYAVPSPTGGDWGYRLYSDPTGSGELTVYRMYLNADATATKEGDMLKLVTAWPQVTVEITVSGDTMTMVVPDVGVFTFSRE